MATPHYNPFYIPFTGLAVHTNPLLVKNETRTVARTWKERLITWPWKPWVATRTEVYQVPSEEIFRIGDRLICHHDMLARIKAEIAAHPQPDDVSKW